MITTTTCSNEALTSRLIPLLKELGVQEWVICPGSRNSPFIQAILKEPNLHFYNWPEERSACFFTLGRIRALKAPVAIVVTSGSAVAELLPACMEAYYSGLPLLLITADRPRRFQGTGSPQCADQMDLFGPFAPTKWDIAAEDPMENLLWEKKAPAHLNLHYEDPKNERAEEKLFQTQATDLSTFLKISLNPFVIVGALKPNDRESAVQFLMKLNAPVYLEAHSGIREDQRLIDLRITRDKELWETAQASGYLIDGVLRIGAVPTLRFWRDLEDRHSLIPVFSISAQPFSGTPRGGLAFGDISAILNSCEVHSISYPNANWLINNQTYAIRLQSLLAQFPNSEPGIIHQLSKKIPPESLIYLGNSLPIREWDLAATYVPKNFDIQSSRGIIGIDGQISTFLGLADPMKDNWAIIGDLTMLYDLAAPWILPQIADRSINIVVINNGGGKIFSHMYQETLFQNPHQLNFLGIAEFWSMNYEQWHEVPIELGSDNNRLIEIIPNERETQEFWMQWNKP